MSMDEYGVSFASHLMDNLKSNKTIISNFCQNGKAVTEMATGCLRMVKMDIFAFNNLRFYFS